MISCQVFTGQAAEQKLVPSDNRSGDFFGQYLSMNYPDILISAHQKNIYGYASGALYVYRANGENDRFNEFQMIFPADGHVEEFFGYSVDMDDTWAITGSHHDSDAGGSSGSAFILKKENSLWTIFQKLTPNDPAPGDEFGKAVCLDGNVVFAGAWLDDDNGSNSGSVYVFEKQEDRWDQIAKIYPDPFASYDQFGNFMASDEGYLLVGVPENAANGPRSGCTYLFTNLTGVWQQVDRWVPEDGHEGAQFGQSVSISGNRAAVGAYKSDGFCADCGAVYLYTKNGDEWQNDTILIAADVQNGDHFGNSVHLQDDLLAVGAYFDDDLGMNSGSVYLYQFIHDRWKLLSKINSSDGRAGDAFGSSVLVSFPYLLTGAYGKSQNGFFSGGAYIYRIDGLVSYSVDTILNRELVLYPTFFDNRICIRSNDAEFYTADLFLYTADGRLLFSDKIKAGQNCLDPGHLPSGLIHFKIVTTDGITTGKLIRL